MVDPDSVVQLQHVFHATGPPVITGIGMHFPAIEGIAPMLAGIAEFVRRNTGNGSRKTGFIQFKQFRIGPDISTVQ